MELGNWQESMHHREHTRIHKYHRILPVKFQKAIKMVYMMPPGVAQILEEHKKIQDA
jgi:hypothetical protein